MQETREVNGTHYAVSTDEKVIRVLEKIRGNKTRIVIKYGDVVKGKCWSDVYNVTGYIGRSTGPKKIPLLIRNKRSTGGHWILDHCIVSIVTARGKHSLYAHPTEK